MGTVWGSWAALSSEQTLRSRNRNGNWLLLPCSSVNYSIKVLIIVREMSNLTLTVCRCAFFYCRMLTLFSSNWFSKVVLEGKKLSDHKSQPLGIMNICTEFALDDQQPAIFPHPQCWSFVYPMWCCFLIISLVSSQCLEQILNQTKSSHWILGNLQCLSSKEKVISWSEERIRAQSVYFVKVGQC